MPYLEKAEWPDRPRTAVRLVPLGATKLFAAVYDFEINFLHMVWSFISPRTGIDRTQRASNRTEGLAFSEESSRVELLSLPLGRSEIVRE